MGELKWLLQIIFYDVVFLREDTLIFLLVVRGGENVLLLNILLSCVNMLRLWSDATVIFHAYHGIKVLQMSCVEQLLHCGIFIRRLA